MVWDEALRTVRVPETLERLSVIFCQQVRQVILRGLDGVGYHVREEGLNKTQR
jgi:hypothetical protein